MAYSYCMLPVDLVVLLAGDSISAHKQKLHYHQTSRGNTRSQRSENITATTSYLSHGDKINERINLQRSLTWIPLMRTATCNGNFCPAKEKHLGFCLYLIVILNCLRCLSETSERCVKTLKLLNSLSHRSLSASNLISVSLRDGNEIIFALSRMCDWHSLQFAHVFYNTL